MFLLQGLAHGSKTFCEKHKIKWANEEECEFGWEYYFGWLKPTLCEQLIKSAITVRMFLDILHDFNAEEPDLEAHQRDAIEGLNIGVVHEGDFTLTLREAFNKIIHATDTQLDWNDEGSYEWWSGLVWLTGKHRGVEWKMDLNVEDFSIATTRLVESLGEAADWSHLYKYDR